MYRVGYTYIFVIKLKTNVHPIMYVYISFMMEIVPLSSMQCIVVNIVIMLNRLETSSFCEDIERFVHLPVTLVKRALFLISE